VSDLHAVTWGDGDPVVLVHGSFGWGEDAWSAQRPLADAFRLVVVDRRGFGDTPADGRVDFDRDAEDIAAFLAEPSHLVGHSYGGVVCLLAAARRPEAVRSLTVIEPPALALVRGRREVETFVDALATAAAEATDPSDYLRRFRAAFGTTADAEPLAGKELEAARSSWHERPPWEAEIPLDALRRAPFPKLVVRGAWDVAPATAQARGRPVFHAICDVLERELEAEGVEVAGAAHAPQALGEPFNERLREFLLRAG
jgi:pimeloyl-ACP methyl ester carboxylesterase